MRDGDAGHRAVGLDHVDDHLVRELRDCQLRQLLERRLVVERRREHAAGLRQELEPPLGRFGLGACLALDLVLARLPQRERHAVGDELHGDHVVLGKAAAARGTDVAHAQELSAVEERHSEQRPQPFQPEQRVHDRDLGEVLDQDRLALGRDASREPLADRDPDRGDLHLEALARCRDEHAVLEQEHRGRVDAQDLPDPGEQLVEKIVERQVRERRLRDRLEAQHAG